MIFWYNFNSRVMLMNLPFIHLVILYCLYRLDGDRSVSSIYHLLKGKKSAQTLQDVHLFGLTPFFKTYESLPRPLLMQAAEHLAQSFFIVESSPLHFQVTEKGRKQAEKFFDDFPFLSYLDGWTYQKADVFWERLTLLVQVVSNLSCRETQYVPVQKNPETQQWVKNFLKQKSFNRREISRGLYTELEEGLSSNHLVDPSVLVLRLTGARHIGMTAGQAAKELQMEETLYHFQFLALLHHLMKTGRTNRRDFPILYELAGEIVRPCSLTNSAKITMNFLRKGLSLEEVASIRRLKINTIQDHIVELALNVDGFDISPYVSEECENAIIAAARKAASKQLKQIRRYAEQADYFQIRLVLAKYGDELIT